MYAYAWATIFCNSCCRLSLNNCVIFILKPNWTKREKKKNFENFTVSSVFYCIIFIFSSGKRFCFGSFPTLLCKSHESALVFLSVLLPRSWTLFYVDFLSAFYFYQYSGCLQFWENMDFFLMYWYYNPVFKKSANIILFRFILYKICAKYSAKV